MGRYSLTDPSMLLFLLVWWWGCLDIGCDGMGRDGSTLHFFFSFIVLKWKSNGLVRSY